MVMQDKSLSPYAKTIYSYLRSYCGNKNECYPSVTKICKDLDINKSTFQKYIKQLKSLGYVDTKQVKENGRFARNIYTILSCVDNTAVHGRSVADSSIDEYAADNNNRSNKNKKNNNTLYKRQREREKKMFEAIGIPYDAPKKSCLDGYELEDFYEKP